MSDTLPSADAAAAQHTSGRVRVGTSGWRYPSWRGDYYPAGLVQRRELEYLSERLSTVEINGSFYSLQHPDSYRRWAEQTPAGFVFGVKGGRFVTHMLRLRSPRTALANFFASGVLLLGEKLGPILWQLPERTVFDRDELEMFCAELPRDHAAAARLAREHDERVKHVEIPEPPSRLPLRHALEPRHPSFGSPEALDVLRRHNVALVTADSPEWPRFEEPTADFVYARLHGAERLYHGGYDDEALRGWARRIHSLATTGDQTRDGYVYFDNDADGRAPFDAGALARKLDAGPAADAAAD